MAKEKSRTRRFETQHRTDAERGRPVARESTKSPFYVRVEFDTLVGYLSGRRHDEGRWFGDEGSLDRSEQHKRDEILIFGRFQERSALTEFYGSDEAFSDAMGRYLLGPAIDAKHEGYRNLRELMEMPPPARRAAVCKVPYRDLYVAELLLQECSKTLPDHPEKAEEMSLAALWIAEQPFPEDEEHAEEIRVRALCTQAEVHRLRQDFPQAEQKLLMALAVMAAPPRVHVPGPRCRDSGVAAGRPGPVRGGDRPSAPRRVPL